MIFASFACIYEVCLCVSALPTCSSFQLLTHHFIPRPTIRKRLVPPVVHQSADYDAICPTDRVSILGLSIFAESKKLEVEIKHAEGKVGRIQVAHSFNEGHIESVSLLICPELGSIETDARWSVACSGSSIMCPHWYGC